MKRYQKATKWCLWWCQGLWGIRPDALIYRCREQVWGSVFKYNISPLLLWHLECKTQCSRPFLHWTFALCSSSLVQNAACWCAVFAMGEDPLVVHYFITLKPALAASCTTCSTFLICSTTSYSFSALLHLIRIDPVPPNNGIMTGTGWLPFAGAKCFMAKRQSLGMGITLYTNVAHLWVQGPAGAYWISTWTLEGLWISGWVNFSVGLNFHFQHFPTFSCQRYLKWHPLDTLVPGSPTW